MDSDFRKVIGLMVLIIGSILLGSMWNPIWILSVLILFGGLTYFFVRLSGESARIFAGFSKIGLAAICVTFMSFFAGIMSSIVFASIPAFFGFGTAMWPVGFGIGIFLAIGNGIKNYH